MNLALNHGDRGAEGIFGTLLSVDEDHFVAATLEHAYPDGEGGWAPRIHPGTFSCKRGRHRLADMAEDFETFEITGVEGHANLLFHWGNWNENSHGCVLLGEAQAEGPHAGKNHVEMITNSRAAFARFMQLQEGVDEFTLEVLN